MKVKKFRHGKYTYKSYMKKAGNGYEVGFIFDSKPVFVGNFIHSKEANSWWTLMNKEISGFTKRFWITPKAPKTFYSKFINNHLYKTYYKFLDKHFSKYNTKFTKEFNKDVRKYKQLKKHWTPKQKTTLKRAA